MIQMILGGARSGKSHLAEVHAKASQKPVIYIATAQALDEEMQSRIQHHQLQRPANWLIIEEPLYLAECLTAIDRENQVILLDCLTLWMSNLLLNPSVEMQEEQCQKFLDVLPTLQSDLIIVSNETGLGVVPMGQITRRFVDETGRLHQQVGQVADSVLFCVAGFPMVLKGEKQ